MWTGISGSSAEAGSLLGKSPIPAGTAAGERVSLPRGSKLSGSAETLASSADRKSSEPALEPTMSTKQFKSSDFTRRSVKIAPPVRKIWPSSTIALERQPSGNPVDFDLYDECDLPFLDKGTEVGRMVSKNII